jgi:hypothetical protein
VRLSSAHSLPPPLAHACCRRVCRVCRVTGGGR